jgi:hypothetical protein
VRSGWRYSFGLAVAGPVVVFWEVDVCKVDDSFWGKVVAVAGGEDDTGGIWMACFGGVLKGWEK